MKKGQTAMEYLMTYGWAILIVIVVIAALYSMGVFTVSPGVACSPCFSYFAFVDYADGTLKIRNGPRNIGFTTDNVTLNPSTLPVLADLDADTLYECFLFNGTHEDECSSGNDITISNLTVSGDVTVTIDYQDVGSALWHSDTGTIHN